MTVQALAERRDFILDQKSSELWVSTKRITEVALYALSGTFVLGGALLLLGSALIGEVTLIVPISLIAVVVGVTTFLVAIDLCDYERKEDRDLYRAEMKNLLEILRAEEREYMRSPTREVPYDFKVEAKTLFNSAIERHGFNNMFRYGIPHPRDFQELWNLMASYMTLDELIAFTEEFRAEYEKAKEKYGINGIYTYEFPHPRVFARRPSCHTFCEDICETMDPDKLLRLSVITLVQYNLLRELKREFMEAKSAYEAVTGSERVTFDDLARPFKVRRDRAIADLDKRLQQHPSKVELRKLRQDEIQALQTVEKSIYLSQAYLDAKHRLQSMERELGNNPTRSGDLEAERARYRVSMDAVKERFRPFKQRIRENFERRRSPLVENMRRMQEEYRIATEKEREQYARDTAQLRQEFAEGVGEPLRVFNAIKARLNMRYSAEFPA